MTAYKAPAVVLSPIADEVLQGLSATPKKLPPKLFYDAEGSRLFEQITELPEYYPTRTERAIFEQYAPEIVAQAGNNLTLVELGAGSASKTRILIEALARRQLRLSFYPIDVSVAALKDAVIGLNGHLRHLRVRPIVADYSHHLPQLSALPGRKLVLFIGSTIGNFEPNEAVQFLTHVRASLEPGDALLVGFDLVKNAGVLHAAYNDAQGITGQFNKNVLARINREAGGHFDLNTFEHVSFWSPAQSRIEMHLESKVEQDVLIDDLSKVFHFDAGERIHTENSYKFTSGSIGNLLRESGLRLERCWRDKDDWFAAVLARVGS
ncbi:MAG: L-histidine N(alpha)-methyltransferase [Candidatus Angelobacter sp. Gp1-AA117]|nr:MAG: L-histidine N(alpha)-methyltransferase [Candidatus Angelobacter sp. Gp1-AA117]